MIAFRLAFALWLMTIVADAAAVTLNVGPAPRADHQTLQAAIDALPEQGGTIRIAPGTYREKLTIARPGVKLLGTGKRPEDVVLVWDDSHASAGGTGKSASVYASGDGFEARNLTIQNDYHLRAGLRTGLRNAEGSQAVALRITADRAVLSHVRLLGAQDTLYAASKSPDSPSRQLFEHCYIEGHVDFIFGDAKAFFDRCEIHGIANQIVMLTAQSKVKPGQDSAYVFDRCRITADAQVGELWLGRAWRPYATVVFMRTRIDAPLQPAGWREWTPGKTNTFDTATYREYASTGPGASAANRAPASKQLSRTEAAGWSRARFLSGNDHWRP
jgi:pectinesterase